MIDVFCETGIEARDSRGSMAVKLAVWPDCVSVAFLARRAVVAPEWTFKGDGGESPASDLEYGLTSWTVKMGHVQAEHLAWHLGCCPQPEKDESGAWRIIAPSRIAMKDREVEAWESWGPFDRRDVPGAIGMGIWMRGDQSEQAALNARELLARASGFLKAILKAVDIPRKTQ